MTAWKIERRQSLRDSSLSPEFSHTIYSFLLLDLMFIILYIQLFDIVDDGDCLDRHTCLQLLAALRHTKWFQVKPLVHLTRCDTFYYYYSQYCIS